MVHAPPGPSSSFLARPQRLEGQQEGLEGQQEGLEGRGRGGSVHSQTPVSAPQRVGAPLGQSPEPAGAPGLQLPEL